MIRIDPADARPIWRQIEEGLRHLVASGALAPSDGVPSVRELARELRINPATVSKAYQRLTGDGLLEVRRGEGTFVAADPPTLSRRDRRLELGAAAQRYAVTAANLGVERHEAIETVEAAIEELEPER